MSAYKEITTSSALKTMAKGQISKLRSTCNFTGNYTKRLNWLRQWKDAMLELGIHPNIVEPIDELIDQTKEIIRQELGI